MCIKRGNTTPATVVDHKKPHKGDPKLFWDEKNWQALCKPCHDAAKRMQEIHGYSQGCDVNGFPLDNEHPWSAND
jgi:5-methylcytosine-specific restriction protein A